MYCKTVIPSLLFCGGFVLGVVLSMLFFVNQNDTASQQKITELSTWHSPSLDIKLKTSSREPKRFDLENLDTKKFLITDFAPRHTPVRLDHPAHLREEYKRRKTVFVGVLSSQMYLATRAKAIHDTWASDVSMLVFFVGEDCIIPPELTHLPIIKLTGVPDGVYPPFKKAFAVIQYMYDHFIDDYDWFIRADDDMYVRGRKLIDLLETFNPNDLISLGRAGEGKEEDMDRLQLLKHERYCMGGPGMIFSQGLMEALGPYINLCVEAIRHHDQLNPAALWNDDDVEIGRCISRELDVQCSTSHEGRIYFYYDFTGDSLKTDTLWENPEFREIITIHPIKDPSRIRALHLFYQTLEYEELYLMKQGIERTITSLCNKLDPELVPPSFVRAECAIEFGTSHIYDSEHKQVKKQVHKHHKQALSKKKKPNQR